MQNEAEAPQGGEPNAHAGSPSAAPGGMIEGGAEGQAKKPQDNLIPMGEHSSFNFALLIAFLVALMAVLAAGYFWWMGKNTSDVVAEKELKLQSIEQQLKAPAMAATEKEANDFKSSVSILSKAKKDRFSVTSFLPSFYTKITNDVKITSLSLGADGTLAIAGSTKSYRTTADLVLALKSWTTLTDVELGSVSMSTGESEGTKPEALFSISAKIVKTPAAVATTATGSAATTTAETATGVTSAPPVAPTTGGTE